VEAHSGNAIGFGRVAASTKVPLSGGVMNEKGLLVGGWVESRAQQNVGSRWDAGLMLGWGENPAEIDGEMGWELYAEFGTPLHETLFRNGSLVGGLALGLPIPIGARRHAMDLNEATWFAVRRFELVPLARARVYADFSDPVDATAKLDVGAGLTLRLRTFSDLF
jgi:hypothetical protein